MASRYTQYDDEPVTEKVEAEKIEREDIPVSRTASVASEPAAVLVKEKESAGIKFLKSIFPWKGDSTTEIIRKIVLIAAVIILVICLPILGKRIYQRMQFANENNKLSELVDLSEGTEDKWAQLKAQYPDVVFPEGMQYKFAKLYALNQDMVGWLKIEGTTIDFPIVQGKDNDEYLYLNFHKKNTSFGNPFLDYRNTISVLNKNTIIYGHHMRDNTIFAQLKKYTSISGFEESPIIEFDTLYNDYKFKVYAVFITNAYARDDNGYVFNYIYTSFATTGKFEEFISQIDQRKLYSTGVDINSSDKIITLSTCDYTFDDARLVVVGRLVRDGESEQVDTSLATAKEQSDIRYPQAYYDKTKKENPFKDAAKWDQ